MLPLYLKPKMLPSSSYKIESRFARFSACGGSIYRHFPLRRRAILHGVLFYRIGKSYAIKKSSFVTVLPSSVTCERMVLPFRKYSVVTPSTVFFVLMPLSSYSYDADVLSQLNVASLLPRVHVHPDHHRRSGLHTMV